MIVALAVLVVVVLGLLRLRARRRAVLAGLHSDRPTYTIAPPTRFSTRLKDHRL